jgi:TolA-binding protein
MKKLLMLSLILTGCFQTRSEIAEKEDRQKLQQQVSQTQTSKAEQESKLQDLEATMRQMNGRLELIEHRMNNDLESRQKETAGKEMTQKQIVDQMKVFQEELTRLDQKMNEIDSRKSSGGVAAAGGRNVKEKEKETDPESWVEAEQRFTQKDWKKAILSYQKYRDENGKGKNFAEATYKIGVSFQELGKRDEAKAFYEEVLEKFPKSKTASKAQYRLKTLK